MLHPQDWLGVAAASVAEWIDQRLESIAAAALVAGTVAIGALALWIAFSGVPTVRGVDMNLMLTLQKALTGQPLYTDPAAPPFDVGQYSPLFYLVCLAISAITGIGADAAVPLLVVCRVLSIACTAASAIVLIRFGTRSLGIPRRICMGCAAFAVIASAPWLFLARPDAMALLLTLTTFSLMARSAHDPRTIGLTVLAAVTAAVTLFTKQNAIQIVPIAVLFYLLLGRWLLAGAFVGVFGLVSGALWVLAVRQWSHFAANVVGGVNNGISLFNAFDKTYANFFTPHAALLGLTLIALLRLLRRRPITWQAAFFAAVLPGLLAVATVTGLKDGSAENYYNEFIFVAVLAVGMLVHQARAASPALLTDAWATSLPRVVAAFILCWLPFHLLMELRDSWFKRVDAHVSWSTPPNSLLSRDYGRLRAIVDAGARSGAGPWVLAFPLAANAAIPGRVLVPQKEIAQTLYNRNVVKYSALQDLIDRGELGFVVTLAGEQEPPRRFIGVALPPVSEIGVVGTMRVFQVQAGTSDRRP